MPRKKRLLYVLTVEVLGNTFNLHFNSTYAQKVWSLNQFICMCLRENKRVTYTHIHTIFYSITKFYMFLSLYITNYLTGLAFWAILMDFCMWLRVGPKGTNKTLAPIGFGHFYQLLTSPKLPLIIFNTTI